LACIISSRPIRSVRPVALDAEVGELADERVGHDLEGERRERAVVVGRPGRGSALLVALDRLDAGDRRDLERRRQQADDRVEQRLHALVLEGGAAEHRGQGQVEGRRAQRFVKALGRDLGILEIGLHELIVGVGASLDQVVTGLLDGVGHLGRDLLDGELHPEVVLPDQGLALDEIDDAPQGVLGADRELDRDRVGAEPLADRPHRHLEIGADAVHLVDEGDPRDRVLVGLPPDGLRLRLDAGDRVEDGDRAVEDAQRALDLDREVDVAGRVDDVDAVVVPLARGRGRGDRDAALLLLLHPVHDGSALVDLAHLVGAARVVEDPLGRRRLARVDVGHDPDIAGLLEGEVARHGEACGVWCPGRGGRRRRGIGVRLGSGPGTEKALTGPDELSASCVPESCLCGPGLHVELARGSADCIASDAAC